MQNYLQYEQNDCRGDLVNGFEIRYYFCNGQGVDDEDCSLLHRLNRCRYCDCNEVLLSGSASSGNECYSRKQRVILINIEAFNENISFVQDADSPKER